jgi:hypothetical protein
VVGDTAERYVPSVPSAAELHLLAEYGYLGECLQWFAVTYGPDAVLNWLEDIVDVVKQGGRGRAQSRSAGHAHTGRAGKGTDRAPAR